MKWSLFLFFIGLMITQNVYSQKMPADYFEEAAAFARKKEYDKAIPCYSYIVTNHKKNDLYHESFFNLAYSFFLLKNYDSASLLFKAIISGDFYDGELVGGSIMASPYANYKNQASELLSKIYYSQQKYDSSLHYLSLSDTLYNYRHFCGNEIDEMEIYVALRYADLYQKLGYWKKAVSSLLVLACKDLASDKSELLKQLRVLLDKNYNSKLIEDLDKALLDMHVSAGGTTKKYYFNFLNTEIPVAEISSQKEYSKEQAIKKVKESNFYKLVGSLR